MSVSLDHVPKYEKQNNISIYVFVLEKDEDYPLSITKSQHERHVNLYRIGVNDIITSSRI